MVKIAANGIPIREAGVSHTHREAGASALKPFQTGMRMLAFLLYLRLKLSLYHRNVIRDM